jgi:hypothetical protein
MAQVSFIRTVASSFYRIGWIGLVGYMIVQSYYFMVPGPRELDTVRKKIAQSLVEKVVYAFPSLGLNKKCLVLPLENDPNGEITELLRETLASTGKMTVPSRSIMEKIFKELKLEIQGMTDLEEAYNIGQSAKVDLVLTGQIPKLEQDQHTASGSIDIQLLDISSNTVVFAQTFEHSISKSVLSPSYVKARIQDSAIWGRVFSWLVICLFLPWALISLVKRILEQESNVYNVSMLAGITLIDVVVALSLMGFEITSFWSWFFLLFAAGGGGFYNYRVCDFISERF